MKTSITSYLGWFLVISALGFYLYGMGYAIILSWPNSGKCDSKEAIVFWPEMATLLTTIQTLLVTNLGIILGISVVKPESKLAKAVLFNNTASSNFITQVNDPVDVKDKIQLWSLWVLVIVLVACLITWIKNNFCTSPAEMVPIVHESGKMFFGVMLGYLTILLRK